MNQQFMEFLQAHHHKVKALQAKFSSIESQAKSAKIVPDRSLLQRFSSAELQKYRGFLSSEGLSRVKQMYPEIFDKQPDPEPGPQTDEMMSGPHSDTAPDEYGAASSWLSVAAAGCYSDYLKCRAYCNDNAIKWFCKGACLLSYIICKCS